MTVVYCITHKDSGKQYVGITNEYRKRCWTHRAGKRLQTAIGRAFDEHGADAFEFSILEKCVAAVAEDRERYWIEKLNTLDPNGYNRNTGGRRDFTVCEESGKMISNSKQRLDNNRSETK